MEGEKERDHSRRGRSPESTNDSRRDEVWGPTHRDRGPGPVSCGGQRDPPVETITKE